MSTIRKPARLNYAPLGPKHEAFHAAADYVRIVIGCVNCGKTYIALAEMLDQLLYNPEGRGKLGLVVARTASHAPCNCR